MNSERALSLSASAILAFAAADTVACTGLDANGNECDVASLVVQEVDEGTWSRVSARLLVQPAAAGAASRATIDRAAQGGVSPTGSATGTARTPAQAVTARELVFDSCSGGADSGMHTSGNACALDDALPQIPGTAWERALARILGRPAGASAATVSPTGND